MCVLKLICIYYQRFQLITCNWNVWGAIFSCGHPYIDRTLWFCQFCHSPVLYLNAIEDLGLSYYKKLRGDKWFDEYIDQKIIIIIGWVNCSSQWQSKHTNSSIIILRRSSLGQSTDHTSIGTPPLTQLIYLLYTNHWIVLFDVVMMTIPLPIISQLFYSQNLTRF